MSQPASIALVTSAELEKIVQYRPNLKPGDKIEGKVIKVRDDGKTLLDFGKFQAAVDLETEVKPGDVLRFVVVERSKQLILKLESPQARTPGEVENLIKQSHLQQEKAIEELQSKIDQLLQKEARQSQQTDTPKQDQRVDNLLKDIKDQLGKFKETLQSSENREPYSKDVQKEIETLLKNLDTALRRVPGSDSALTAQRLETLDKALRNLGASLETNRAAEDINEIRDRLVEQVNRLKELVEKSGLDPAVKKDMEAALAKLSDAAAKIGQLKSPEQLPELREIITREIQPGLEEIREILGRREIPAGTPIQEAAADITNIKDRVETLQKEIDKIDIALQKSPATPKDIDALLKSVEKALSDVSETPTTRVNQDTAALQKEVGSDLIALRAQFQALEKNDVLPREVKSEAENLLKNAANVLRNLPTADSDAPRYTERLEDLARAIENLRTYTASAREFVELRDQVADQVTQLKELLEKSGVRVSKEVEVRLARLAEAAEQIRQLKSPEQLPELREMISREITPALNDLRQALEQETVIRGSEKYRVVNEATRRVENLQKEMETVLQKLSLSPLPGQDMDVLLKDADSALAKLSEVLDLSRYAHLRAARGDAQPAQDISRNEAELRQEIATDVGKIREYAQEPLSISTRETLPPETRQELVTLMQRVGETVKQLPRTPESTEQLENLANAVKSLRSGLETGRDIDELREQIVKQIEQLQARVRDLPPDSTTRKEVEAIMDKLTRAAEKIEQLKSPDQLPELRQVIEQEIRPNLSALNETLGRTPQTPEAIDSRETLETRDIRDIREMRNQVEDFQREIDTALKKLPAEAPKEIEPLLKDVEAALSKVSELSTLAAKAPPQFSESIQALYENIKAALRLLQVNLQVSGNKLEIPEEIRHIFQGLQTNLKLSEVSDTLSGQLTQLRTLIEEAGIPLERVVKEVLGSIEEMQARLAEIKAGGNVKDLQEFLQQQLKPLLDTMSSIFNNHRLLGEIDHPQKLAQAMQTLRTLQSGVENMLSKGLEPSTELSQLTELSSRLSNLPPEVKEALSQAPAGQRVSESISHLAKNIENLLSGIAESLPEAATMIDAESVGGSGGAGGPGSTGETDSAALAARIRTLLSTLRSHFEPLDIGQDALKLVPRLKSLLEDSGIFFEKKLNDIIAKLTEASERMRSVQTLDQLPEIKNIIEKDLKPNLLQLREFLNNEKIAGQLGEAKTLDSIRTAVEDMLANISQQQTRAVEQQAQQNPVQVFSFHVPIKGEENPAELKVFYNKNRKKESPEEYKLSLFLEMDRIGEIRSDFFQLKEDLTITFYVKDDDVKEYFDGHLYEVEEALGSVFDSVNLNVIVSRKKIAAFETEELEQEIISEKAVNVKV